jgi:hypothetical protein
MCGLCGVLAGADHWADTAGAAPGATRSGTRQLRTRLANAVLAHYGLKLKETPAATLQLQNRTGQTVLVPHLGALWPAAERLAKRPCDPLDADLIAALARASATATR